MRKWVIDINDKLNNHRNGQSQEEPCRRKRSIYKIPPLISDHKKKAYQPQVVSFGPYHYGEPHLKPMEDHKLRALLHVLNKSQVSLDTIFDSIVKVAQELKDSYDSLEREWQDNTEKFVQLMIMDGCFMLELLRVAYQPNNYYSNYDPVFSQYGDVYVMPFIMVDMLLLENQLSMLLLLKLKGILEKTELDINIEALNMDILWLLNYDIRDDKYSKMGECLHVLDLHRKGLLHRNAAPQSPNQRAPQSPNQGKCDYPILMGKYLLKLDLCYKYLLHTHNKPRDAAAQSPNQGEGKNKGVGHRVVRPATELHEAGICFMKSESKSLRDITFDDGFLKLPNFTVDDRTESMFLNLLAFERCHIPAGSDVTSFVAFMDRIIEDSRDIKLLSSKGIINNFIGTDKEAADLFNTMSKDLVLMIGNLDQVYTNLINYSNKRSNKWRASLIQIYFRSPWTIISVIAAFLLFSLTGVQTIFTILN
ncbi:UPF0481 protein At3g47200-like [Diospyros lotus]|uniref:UPF0481 protein At3g47200-like n=1 Tax=Diospyros lotus TaxID=55363 RepID=UPI0022588DC9|nr:UPF0481 protein At3g47200-like [Diospyros lotus]